MADDVKDAINKAVEALKKATQPKPPVKQGGGSNQPGAGSNSSTNVQKG